MARCIFLWTPSEQAVKKDEKLHKVNIVLMLVSQD